MTKRGQRLGTFKKRYYIFRESLLKKFDHFVSRQNKILFSPVYYNNNFLLPYL